jgi:hypothetical protein
MAKKVEGIEKLVKDIKMMNAGIKKAKTLDGRVLVEKGQVVESMSVDTSRLSENEKQAMEQAQYLKALEKNKLKGKHVDNLVTDILENFTKGLI